MHVPDLTATADPVGIKSECDHGDGATGAVHGKRSALPVDGVPCFRRIRRFLQHGVFLGHRSGLRVIVRATEQVHGDRYWLLEWVPAAGLWLHYDRSGHSFRMSERMMWLRGTAPRSLSQCEHLLKALLHCGPEAIDVRKCRPVDVDPDAACSDMAAQRGAHRGSR